MLMIAIANVLPAAEAAPVDPAVPAVIAASYAPSDVVIDTDSVTMGPHSGVVRDGVAVFTFGELTLSGSVEIVGGRPLALLTTGDLTVTTPLVVRGQGAEAVAGGFTARSGQNGVGPGRGRAYDVGTGAGFCGAGGDADDGQRRGGATYDPMAAAPRIGGSSGGSSEDPAGSIGGGGGGAIELGALGVLSIGSLIDASGGDAAPNSGYAGGGGSGGYVLLHGGAGSECHGTVRVDGGDGGDSSDDKGGGGGGAGCIVALGLQTPSCDLSARGGAGGDGSATADSGAAATPIVDPDPDYDGDGVTVGEGDPNDLDPTITEEEPPAPPPDDTASVDTAGIDTGGSTDDTGAKAEPPPRERPLVVEVPEPTSPRGAQGFRVCGHAPGPPILLAFGLVLLGLRRGSGRERP